MFKSATTNMGTEGVFREIEKLAGQNHADLR
jgi:hypothetical protein